uniref:Enolase C-terminal domain-containing protein n=1 Tax=Plectus sambesii TaxID=2011161 RepID=A0A914VCA9_9BILA
MAQVVHSCSWKNNTVILRLEPYPLNLRTSFGTSHSATSERFNGLVTIKVNELTGYGECAMPPKKPGVYLADYNDCVSYFEAFIQHIVKTMENFDEQNIIRYDPFGTVPAEFFSALRNPGSDQSDNIVLLRAIFHVMDTISESKLPESRVARNAIEMALLDLWGQTLHSPTVAIILGSDFDLHPKPGYYTIAMNSDSEEMIRSTHFGLQRTPYLKLKMDRNISFWSSWLPKLHKICSDALDDRPFHWSIDANADWTPRVALDMLQVLAPFRHIITMVEQPFPVHMSDEGLKEWALVKTAYEKSGFAIYADESVGTSDDVIRLISVAHGVNIKLDKAGGVREALRTFHAARAAGLDVWFGIMVCSRLSTSMAACLLPLSILGGDLDGELLVDEVSDRFTGGLDWHASTGFITPPRGYGLGLQKK